MIAESAYNNAKSASINHTPFMMNCGYQSRILYILDVNPCFQSKLADKLSAKLKELMIVYWENLYHAQEL